MQKVYDNKQTKGFVWIRRIKPNISFILTRCMYFVVSVKKSRWRVKFVNGDA